MSNYKLVVVLPFGNYRKGEVIFDQVIVDQILDSNNLEMHQLERNVRRVLLKDSEMELAYPKVIPISQNDDELNVNLSSVKDEEFV